MLLCIVYQTRLLYCAYKIFQPGGELRPHAETSLSRTVSLFAGNLLFFYRQRKLIPVQDS